MKKGIALMVCCLLAAAAFSQTGYISMSPAQFKTALDNEPNKKLIDVRQDWEFKKGHLEHAVNIDVMGDDFETKVSAIPRETPIYLYCYSGGRGVEAAEKLKALGFKKVVNMTGGYSAWEKALLPVTK